MLGSLVWREEGFCTCLPSGFCDIFLFLFGERNGLVSILIPFRLYSSSAMDMLIEQ